METARTKRVGLGVVDQVLSSAGNMLVVFAIAGVSTVTEFGVISLAIAGVMALALLCSGLLGTPIALLSNDHERLRVEAGHALAVAGIVGVCGGAIIASFAFLASDPWAVVLVAAAAPALLMQGCGRYVCISAGRPQVAVFSDGVLATGSAAMFVLAGWVFPEASPRSIVAGWVVLGITATTITLARIRSRPVLRGLPAWLRATADRFRYGATSAVGAVNGIVFFVVVAALIGPAAVAALRGSASIMGPLSILLSSLTLVAVPELRRLTDASAADYWRPMLRVGPVMCVIPIAVGIASFFVPDSWGEVILGPTWSVAQPLLPITAVEYVFLVWNYSADAILRTQANSRAVLRFQILHAILLTGCGAVAAIVFGTAIAVAVGLAVGVSLATVYGVARTFDRPRERSASPDQQLG